MLSNALLKKLASFKSKKFRQKYCQFIVEGRKSIKELKETSFYPELLLFKDSSDSDIVNIFPKSEVIENCGDRLKKISSFENLPDVLAVLNFDKNELQQSEISNDISLFLDEIQDPGNLGTIIRLAVWYGFPKIALSKGCVDIYNPKTIQSSMGAFAKIKFVYTEKNEWLEAAKNSKIEIAGTFLEGENIHKINFKKPLIIVIGNEGHGISADTSEFIDKKITIPGTNNIESLNAAMASAVVLDNVYRNLNS